MNKIRFDDGTATVAVEAGVGTAAAAEGSDEEEVTADEAAAATTGAAAATVGVEVGCS